MTGEHVPSSQNDGVAQHRDSFTQAVFSPSNSIKAIAPLSEKQSHIIQRYLDHYAEPQSRQRPELPQTTYQHVLVIPAFDEPVGCLEQVLPETIRDTLVIVVVNAAEDSDRASIQRTQQFLLAEIAKLGSGSDAGANADLFTARPLAHQSTLVIVDCCTEGRQLPAKQGVGLARKIGGDIALAYIAQGTVETLWIHYTDADVVLPDDFFDARVRWQGGTGADDGDGKHIAPTHPLSPHDVAVMLYPFRHQPSHAAILRYEISLRHYVTQLAKARSPYAFHTIGSLMCVNGLHYAKVRGFPKRKAAEDFYMLNKLAKTGAVLQLQTPIVALDSRLSHRVPFGTGAMMTKLHNAQPMASPQDPPLLFYQPAIFHGLREWLDCIDALWPPIERSQAPNAPRKGTNQGTPEHRTQDPNHVLKSWFTHSPWHGAPWVDCLLEMGLGKTLQQAYRQSRDRHHFQRYMWTWFDAFRTLKFAHYLRDHHYPSLTASELWQALHPQASSAPPNLETDSQNNTQNHEGGPLNVSTLEQANQWLWDLEATFPPLVGPTLGVRSTQKTIKPQKS